MTSKNRTDWPLIFLAIVIAITAWIMLSGCGSCPPAEVVTVPVEVEVPVPVPPKALDVPVPPEYETCDQDVIAEVLSCVARNVVKLRAWASELLAELEAHNSALEP